MAREGEILPPAGKDCDMRSIFAKLLYEMEKGHDTMLATIVADDGSAPRGKGSQMLVGA